MLIVSRDSNKRQIKNKGKTDEKVLFSYFSLLLINSPRITLKLRLSRKPFNKEIASDTQSMNQNQPTLFSLFCQTLCGEYGLKAENPPRCGHSALSVD
jgi:hypothetical protein